MLLNAAKCQGSSFYRFWVIKGKPTLGGVGGKTTPPPPPTQIKVNYNRNNNSNNKKYNFNSSDSRNNINNIKDKDNTTTNNDNNNIENNVSKNVATKISRCFLNLIYILQTTLTTKVVHVTALIKQTAFYKKNAWVKIPYVEKILAWETFKRKFISAYQKQIIRTMKNPSTTKFTEITRSYLMNSWKLKFQKKSQF